VRVLLASLVVLALAAVAAPAAADAARRTATVTITAHLRSEYRFSIDWFNRDDPECPSTSKGESRVITDMRTVRPATYRITRYGRRGFGWVKRLGVGQKNTRGIDMRVKQTRSTSGSTRTCRGDFSFPADGCGTERWDLAVTPGFVIFDRRRVGLSLEEIFDTVKETLDHDEYVDSGCGVDSTNASRYITQTRDLATGKLQKSYEVRAPRRRFFARRGRRFTARGRSTFSTGMLDSSVGRWTETRTSTVKVRTR